MHTHAFRTHISSSPRICPSRTAHVHPSTLFLSSCLHPHFLSPSSFPAAETASTLSPSLPSLHPHLLFYARCFPPVQLQWTIHHNPPRKITIEPDLPSSSILPVGPHTRSFSEVKSAHRRDQCTNSPCYFFALRRITSRHSAEGCAAGQGWRGSRQGGRFGGTEMGTERRLEDRAPAGADNVVGLTPPASFRRLSRNTLRRPRMTCS
ncbi:hypothetical protein B0H13DRAFT_132178 [Mycena leptocephala]|nr:hypothetical protein B0H13DRAFT_132178 [Mycena leptocephala]